MRYSSVRIATMYRGRAINSNGVSQHFPLSVKQKSATGKRTSFDKYDTGFILGIAHCTAANPTALAPIGEELKPTLIVDVRCA